MTSNFYNLKNVNKTVRSYFPRLNQNHYLETSIEHTYEDIYYPINTWSSDRFIEFRIPKTIATFIDLANLNLQFKLQVNKKNMFLLVYGARVKKQLQAIILI